MIFQSKFSLLKFLNVINFLNLIFVDVSGGAVQGDQEEWECAVCEGGRVPAHQTRQVNLLPCLETLASRSSEAIHETLALSFPSLFAVLGPHSNDNEVRLLLKAFLANVGSSR